jgi:hypothetical protein
MVQNATSRWGIEDKKNLQVKMLNRGIRQPSYHQGKRLSNKQRNKKKNENTWK